MKLNKATLFTSLLFCSGLSFASTTWMEEGINKNYAETVQLRRDIHRHPELGNQEINTQQKVVNYLKQQGIEVVTGWKNAPTAVIGIINPDKKNTVALRSELDALPIKENTGLSFASQSTGQFMGQEVPVSHMCGHDVHMAMLLSAAKILQQNKDKFNNRVVLIFQPAEEGDSIHDLFDENLPVSGANALVQDGLMEKYAIKRVFGIHVMARLPAGKMWIAQGPALNSVDDFIIKVEGKQSHGAMPWAGSDATLTAANIVVALQQIVSRNADLSSGMGVITVGKLTAGETANVMSGKAEMVGTIRSNNADIRQTLLTRIPQVAEGIADAAGAKAITQIVKIYPVTMNNPQLVETMVPLLQKQGIDAEINNWNPGASEDFSFYAQKAPGMFMFLGADAAGTSDVQNNHSDKFNVDETTMRTGVMAHLVAATSELE